MNEQDILQNKIDRELLIQRHEVLEKVKNLLVIPNFDAMTLKQVADYYEVKSHAIETICSRNSDELESDGVCVKKISDFLNSQYVSIENTSYKKVFTYDNGVMITVTNRGIKLFPKRAILRIGMLLRESVVAKEVRTQLLNIEEKISNNAKISFIKIEQNLLDDITNAYKSGDIENLMRATSTYNKFQARYIKELEEKAKIVDEMMENKSSVTLAITQKIKNLQETQNWKTIADSERLGKTTKLVLVYIHDYINSFGISPTVRDVCKGVGLRSTSSVHAHIDKLDKLGFLVKNPSMPRHIRINEDKYMLLTK